MTKKEKLETFDTVNAERMNNALAVHDLVNGAFGSSIRLNPAEIDENWQGGYYTMRMSPRAMPLFLIVYVCKGQADHVTQQDCNDLCLLVYLTIFLRTRSVGGTTLVALRSLSSRVLTTLEALNNIRRNPLAERNASLVSLGILTGKNCFFSGIAHTPTFLLAICLPALLQLLTWSRSLRLHHRFASLTENLSSFNGSYLRCSYTLSIFTGTRAAPRRAAEDKTAGEYRLAFAEGRLKKRKLPKRGIKIWVEPKAA